MKTSYIGRNLIKAFEGYRSEAYLCPAGKWTIGYGHTSGVKEGDTCTKEQAISTFRKTSSGRRRSSTRRTST